MLPQSKIEAAFYFRFPEVEIQIANIPAHFCKRTTFKMQTPEKTDRS